jgi:hypothetical protein
MCVVRASWVGWGGVGGGAGVCVCVCVCVCVWRMCVCVCVCGGCVCVCVCGGCVCVCVCGVCVCVCMCVCVCVADVCVCVCVADVCVCVGVCPGAWTAKAKQAPLTTLLPVLVPGRTHLRDLMHVVVNQVLFRLQRNLDGLRGTNGTRPCRHAPSVCVCVITGSTWALARVAAACVQGQCVHVGAVCVRGAVPPHLHVGDLGDCQHAADEEAAQNVVVVERLAEPHLDLAQNTRADQATRTRRGWCVGACDGASDKGAGAACGS